MKMFAGYYKNDDHDLLDTQYDISVNSCGRYELISQKAMKTIRPQGRADFQLLYVLKGEALFTINGKVEALTEGNMVIYFPFEEQIYSYYKTTSPIVYWIHFTGFNVKNILKDYNITKSQSFFVGTNSDLSSIFDKIIAELNLARLHYLEICRLYLKQLITLSARSLQGVSSTKYQKNEMLDKAIKYFNEHSDEQININEYARQNNISCCWFIRSFKNYTGTTPAHYINTIRINKAKSLLANGTFSIGDVASMVGYDNALYFSRIFKKYVSVAPKSYF